MKYDELSEIISKYDITDWGVLNVDEVEDFIPQYPPLPSELSYLKKPERRNIKLWWEHTKSVIILVYQYWGPEKKYEERISRISNPYDFLSKKYKNIEFIKMMNIKKFKIARYALVEEYHKKIKEYNQKILNEIIKKHPQISGRIFVDTSPIYEKRLSYLAGLGFIGKNTLLISPVYGSYIFISGIAINDTVKEKPEKTLKKNMCGSCNKCIRVCPTKALDEKGLIPQKCISFWTTHTKTAPPSDIINSSEYIFGCDICQEVCPFNINPQKGKTIF